MRTTLALDDDLLAQALTGLNEKSSLVRLAITPPEYRFS